MIPKLVPHLVQWWSKPQEDVEYVKGCYCNSPWTVISWTWKGVLYEACTLAIPISEWDEKSVRSNCYTTQTSLEKLEWSFYNFASLWLKLPTSWLEVEWSHYWSNLVTLQQVFHNFLVSIPFWSCSFQASTVWQPITCPSSAIFFFSFFGFKFLMIFVFS